MDTEIIGNKKFISLKLNAKYKSKFADYFGKKGNSDVNIGNKIIKNNRTTKYLDKYDKFINFTNLKKNSVSAKSYLSRYKLIFLIQFRKLLVILSKLDILDIIYLLIILKWDWFIL